MEDVEDILDLLEELLVVGPLVLVDGCGSGNVDDIFDLLLELLVVVLGPAFGVEVN